VRRPPWPTLALAGFAAVACRHKPPYAPGQGPEPPELLEASARQIEAVQVADARVVLNRLQRGKLAFIAMAPARFRGGVSFAGNELVTLAFHEEGYALRYKLDAYPQGFYEGPPDGCAVRALLGIDIDTESLTALVLGGAPVIDQPFEIVKQKWSRKHGYEALTLRNAKYVQELRFGWVDGTWQFVGGQMWQRDGNKTGRRLWTVEHTSLVKEGDAYLPERTKVSTPGRRRDNQVAIVYKERNIDPAFAKQVGDGGDDGDDGWDDGADDWGGDAGGDGWEDEGGDGWEGEGGDGWEDGASGEPAPGGSTPPADGSTPPDDGGAPADGDAPTEPEDDDDGWENETGATCGAPPADGTKKPAPSAPKSKIPDVFFLVPGTLQHRGDLCK